MTEGNEMRVKRASSSLIGLTWITWERTLRTTALKLNIIQRLSYRIVHSWQQVAGSGGHCLFILNAIYACNRTTDGQRSGILNENDVKK